MRTAAASPPAQTPGRDHGGPALGVRVDGGGHDPGAGPGRAAEQRQQDGLGQELDPDPARGRPECPEQPISLRRSSSEMTMTFATPTVPTSNATEPKAIAQPTTPRLSCARDPAAVEVSFPAARYPMSKQAGRDRHSSAEPVGRAT
jgi:hypothetical protein